MASPEVQAYTDRIVIRQDGVIVAEHARCFGRNETIYDPWHYVPVLVRKPGALRNGAPFRDWILPGALGRVRQKLRGTADGDRQTGFGYGAYSRPGAKGNSASCLVSAYRRQDERAVGHIGRKTSSPR